MNKKPRSGTLYKRGRVYWLRFFMDGKLVQHSLGTTDADEAETLRKKSMRPIATIDRAAFLASVQAQLSETRQQVEDDKPLLEISEAWRAYLRATTRPDSGDRTLFGYESIFKRFNAWIATQHPRPRFMRDVNTTMARSYVTTLTEQGVTASTFNQHLGFLRLLFKVLAPDVRGDGNPFEGIQKKRLQKIAHRHNAFTSMQVDRILASTPDSDLRDLMTALAWTGQRLADCVFLRWDSIDERRKVITLSPRKTKRTGKAVHIPLMPPLAACLNARPRDGELVFPAIAEAYDRDPSAVVKKIQTTIEAAGISTREKMPNVARAVVKYGAHSFRHFFATAALEAGIPSEIVRRITGHSSDSMLSNYEHIDASMIASFAERLSHGATGAPESTAKALPPCAPLDVEGRPPDAAHAKLDAIATLVKTMTAKNWKQVKAEILKEVEI